MWKDFNHWTGSIYGEFQTESYKDWEFDVCTYNPSCYNCYCVIWTTYSSDDFGYYEKMLVWDSLDSIDSAYKLIQDTLKEFSFEKFLEDFEKNS